NLHVGFFLRAQLRGFDTRRGGKERYGSSAGRDKVPATHPSFYTHTALLSVLNCPGQTIRAALSRWSRYPLQLSDPRPDRFRTLVHLRPEIPNRLDARRHRAQCKRSRLDAAALHFLPGARRRHRRAWLRPHGVRGGERRAVTVPAGVQQNAIAAIGF